jgi:hypothetical protein
MYAILNPDGSFAELREGEIGPGENTQNRTKRYAVPYSQTKPTLQAGEEHVLSQRQVTADSVTDVFLVQAIASLPKSDAEVLIATLIRKRVVTRAEVDAERLR